MNPFVYITEKDLVYASILSFLFLFLSFIFYIRFEPTDLPGLYNTFYGYPLGWLKTSSHVARWYLHDIEILWQELFLDFILWFLLSLTLVYALGVLRENFF